MKKQIIKISLLAILFLVGFESASADWEAQLKSTFSSAKVVETFDNLQDWTPGGQFYSSAGCDTCASNSTLPKNNDGSDSIWTIWNSKGMSFEYTPGNGIFARGDVITGSISGATDTIERIWELDGKSYIQITSTDGVQQVSNFVAGENISSGSKTGTNIQWPLFIADHGPSHNWRGTGKSLMMDLGDNNASDLNPAIEGIGAQRLGTYFGDGITGKSGFKKAHVFFMIKLGPEFFNDCITPDGQCLAGGYDTVGAFLKMFELNSGFVEISKWGTAEDLVLVDPAAPSYYRLDEYGLNFSVFNFYGGGASHTNDLYFTKNIHVASEWQNPGLYTYLQTQASVPVRNGTTLDIENYFENNEWFAVEMAQDLGTKDLADGTTDFWIYDQNGVEKGHYASTENHLNVFDHYYNKFVMGGNRGSLHDMIGGLDTRWWVDDIVINDSRIGPTYFSTLASFQGPADETAPAAPTGLGVE
ncbi:MAG: hypothetical protein ACD_56C00061G0004 [uncultured bacterium]|nr:MAG: hypothetical protein ACD_56C00061G0004 [uncultured bacterium]